MHLICIYLEPSEHYQKVKITSEYKSENYTSEILKFDPFYKGKNLRIKGMNSSVDQAVFKKQKQILYDLVKQRISEK